MNIAIFGGSFDPPHIGHEQIAYKILDNINIDKLFIIPTFLNPFKTTFYLSADVRLELVKQLFKNNSKITILDFEVKQQKKVTTYETIKFLQAHYKIKKVYCIIGADNLKNIDLWYNFEELKKIVTFVVISRKNYQNRHKSLETINIDLDINISSSCLRKNMDIQYIPKTIRERIKKIWKID